MRPDTSCNEASDKDVGSQSTAEERLGPQFEILVEDAPFREMKLVRSIVPGDCTCVRLGSVPSSVSSSEQGTDQLCRATTDMGREWAFSIYPRQRSISILEHCHRRDSTFDVSPQHRFPKHGRGWGSHLSYR
jgi:hypothetical protein